MKGTIATDGVVTLRFLESGDASELATLANNRKISDNLRDGFPHPYTFAHAEQFIAMANNMDPITFFAIDYNGLYVGNISLLLGADVYRKNAEIGYFIGEPYWNKGIATRAVKLITEFGFEQLNMVRIYTGIFDYNTASQRVMEKCGFKKEAIFEKAICKHNQLYNEVRFALINRDYSFPSLFSSMKTCIPL